MISVNPGVGSKILSKIFSKIIKRKFGIDGKFTLDLLEVDKSPDNKESMDVILHVRMSMPITDVDALIDKF